MNKFLNCVFIIAAFAVTATVSTSANAHSDVLLANVGGQVALGTADLDELEFSLGLGASETILLPGFSLPTSADYEASEPGFYALNGVADAGELTTLGASALPGNALISLSTTTFDVDGVSADLFYWDGTGAVDFNPAPAGTTFAFSPSAFTTSGANGEVHSHPLYQLDATSGVPTDGVYLISPVADVAGLTTSDKFYMVFLADSLITGEPDAELVEEALKEL